MTEISDTDNIFVVICQAICDAGRPLSRLEISLALEPRMVANMRDILEGMLKSGVLVSYVDSGEHKTTIVKYNIADMTFCAGKEYGGQY